MPTRDPSDPWEKELTPSAGSEARPVKPKSQHQVIPDDWDDDEEEDDTFTGPEMNKRIWDEANNKAPMPEVLVKPPGGGSSTTITPPAAAFQPQMRILKRPSTTPPAVSASSSLSTQRDTIHEREARYNAARERIFGSGDQGRAYEGTSRTPGLTSLSVSAPRATSRSSTPSNHAPRRTNTTRDPRGPSDYLDDNSTMRDSDRPTSPRGFGRRLGDKPPPPSHLDEKSLQE